MGGFILVGRRGGGEPSVFRYTVATSNGTAIFRNDIVKLTADGDAVPIEAGNANVMLGSVQNIYSSADAPISYLAASTAGYVEVCDDAQAIYKVDTDAALTKADGLGNNTDMVATAGSTLTGLSGHVLDATVETNGATAQFRILDIVETPDNAWGNNPTTVLVTPNEHLFNQPLGV